ncbi:hypothetical protein [Haloparvum sedimenti]|uniref:hypothetical protein n=1 Tax=Haloparvum sedimenti TaxID=1678448 RepID=UPI00071E8C49|nr:hypothetical protein [Haloparvum sedimenti]
MSYPVTYYCPRCETLVKLDRDGYLADKSVTPYPLEGWTYVSPDGDYEADDADGVRFVCGEEGRLADGEPNDAGCGEPFYLSFVRFEDGREVEPRAESEFVTIDPDPRSSGPRGPSGPGGGGGSGGFWP